MTYPWETLKPVLHYLYLQKNLTLDQVSKEIEARYHIAIQSVIPYSSWHDLL